MAKETGNSSRDALVGKEVGRYKLLKLISDASQPLIYQAKDRINKTLAAVYLMPPQFVSANKKSCERFLVEARVAAKVTHEAFIPIVEAATSEGFYYVGTSWVEGVTIASSMLKRGKLGVEEAVEVGIQTARGLQASHAAGVIHRTISPQVLWYSSEGQVLIGRLGVMAVYSRLDVNSKLDSSESAAFWSPEMLNAGIVDGRSDVYSLGATLYFFLTGRIPYSGTVAEVREKFAGKSESPRADKVNPRVPKRLGAIIAKMLSASPDKRYGDMKAVISKLEQVLSQPEGEESGHGVSPELLAKKQEAVRLVSEAEVRFVRLRARLANRPQIRLVWAVILVMAVVVLGTTAAFYVKARAGVKRELARRRSLEREEAWLEKINALKDEIKGAGSLKTVVALGARIEPLGTEGDEGELDGLRQLYDRRLQEEFDRLKDRAGQKARAGQLAEARRLVESVRGYRIKKLDDQIPDALAMVSKMLPVKPPVSPPVPPRETPRVVPVDTVPRLLKRLAVVSPSLPSLGDAIKGAGESIELGSATYVKGRLSALSGAFSHSGRVQFRRFAVGLAEGGRSLVVFRGSVPVLAWEAPSRLAGSSWSGKSIVKASRTRTLKIETVEEVEGEACRVVSRVVVSPEGRSGARINVEYDLKMSRVLKNALQFGAEIYKSVMPTGKDLVVHYRPFGKSIRKDRPFAEALAVSPLRLITFPGENLEVRVDMDRWSWSQPPWPLRLGESPESVFVRGAGPQTGESRSRLEFLIRSVRSRRGSQETRAVIAPVSWPDLAGKKVRFRTELKQGQGYSTQTLRLEWTGDAVDIYVLDKKVGVFGFGEKHSAFLEEMGTEKCLFVSRVSGAQRVETFFMLESDGVRIQQIWSPEKAGGVAWSSTDELTLMGSGFGGWESADCTLQLETGRKVVMREGLEHKGVRWCFLKGKELEARISVERQSLLVGASSARLVGKEVKIIRPSAINSPKALSSMGRVAIIFSGKGFLSK